MYLSIDIANINTKHDKTVVEFGKILCWWKYRNILIVQEFIASFNPLEEN